MFDFFAEIIEFLGQLVTWAVFFFKFILHGIGRVTTTFSQFRGLLESIPTALSSFVIFLLAILIFEFIRGRK